MAEYPAHDSRDWDDDLKAYIDSAVEGTVEAAGYDVVPIWGQSNGSGRGTIDALVDVRHSKVWQYASDGAEANRKNRITTADEPLGHADRLALGNTLGPGGPFGSWYADHIGRNRRVLLVPSAFGGTGFSTTAPNDWRNEAGSLYRRAVSQANAALVAAGPGSRLAAILWVQGEADAEGDPNENPARAAMTPSAYRTAFDALITGARNTVTGASSATPFIIGRMAPGFIARGSNHQAVDAVHRDTPNRLPNVLVASGPSGHDDATHYDAVGVRTLGFNMFSALLASTAGPPPPPEPFTDTFARANADTLGAAYTVGTGVFGVRDGKAALLTVGNSGPPWDVGLHEFGASDATATWSLTGSNLDLGDIGVVFRASDASNYWLARIGSDGAQVYKIIDGSPNSVGSFAANHSTTAQDMTIDLNGSTIVIKMGQIVATTLTDDFNLGATKFGLWASQVGNSGVDAFSVVPS